MNKYISEAIGAFFLAITFILAVNNEHAELAPFAFGAVWVGLTVAGFPVSGAHYNPVFTIAASILGKIEREDTIAYIVAQVLGSLLAAFLGVFLLHCARGGDVPLHHNSSVCALISEFLGAALLVYVFLRNAYSRAGETAEQNKYVLGLTYIGMMLLFGNISAAIFNPALALGTSLAGMTAWDDMWIYLVGPLVGAAAGSTMYTLLQAPES